MRRRDFITVLGGAATAWPLAARAQQTGKLPTIGFLGQTTRSGGSEWVAAFVQRLHELGWNEGRTIAIEYRWAEGREERFAEVAAEFARLKVDIIVTSGTPQVVAAKQATSVIPIVFAAAGDPVAGGLVASLARPGGNITGLTGSTDDTAPKQLELLAAVVVSPSRIALLGNPDSPTYPPVRKSALEAAKKAGLLLVTVEARNPQETENAFAAFVTHRVEAVMVAS